jgi:hypothetical protein
MASPIDELYKSIFGELPKKNGTAYELLATAAWKLLDDSSSVAHDTRMRGVFSESLYQIDVDANDKEGRHAGEAKDYTDRSAKVGRSDLQKLGGALPDIDVRSGKFFSATGYTKPAQQYASNAERIVGKKIDLYGLSLVTDKDLQGRIKKIIIAIHIITPAYERSRFTPVLTTEAEEVVEGIIATTNDGETSRLGVESIYASDGSIMSSISELTSIGYGDGTIEKRAWGSWILTGGHLMSDGHLIPIHGITYDISFDEVIEEIVIEASGKAMLLLKSIDGSVNKVLCDLDLKRIAFDDNGNAVVKG